MGLMTMLIFLKVFGLISFIFTVLLLAVSFFVLFVTHKIHMRRLKLFGYVIAVLLWICAAIVFSAVISLSLAGRSLRMPMTRGMRGPTPPMMQQEPPAMMPGSRMDDEEMMPQKRERPGKIR